ncbi:MAG: DUF4199 domain-containing protein [Bacteroidales bacterium]|nr:DUF4199 domain-containing protein [Bacteroidales bacterium]
MKDKILNKWQNRLVYGAVAGGILLVYKILMIVFFGNAQTNSSLNIIDMIFVASLLVVTMTKGINRYREEQLEGFITYSQGFGQGFFISLIACVLHDLPTWVYNSFISATYKEEYLEQSYNMMYEMYGSEMADSMSTILENTLLTPSYMFFAMLLSAALTSLILSAVVAMFTKKEKVF